MVLPTIFLSYAREDQPAVKEIYDFLRSSGFDPWMDVEKILPGQNWRYEIELAIESADFFVACLSKKSVDKTGFVHSELKQAIDVLRRFPEGKVFLIPVRLDDCLVPRSLNSQNWLDWFDTKSRDKLLETIKLYYP